MNFDSIASTRSSSSTSALTEGEREFFESTRPPSEKDARPPLSEQLRQLSCRRMDCHSTVALILKALQRCATNDEFADVASHALNVLPPVVEVLAEIDAETSMLWHRVQILEERQDTRKEAVSG